MANTIRIGLFGAAGRMGRILARMVLEDARLELAAAIEGPSSPHLGQDIGTLAGLAPAHRPIRTDADALDVLIDFSTASALDSSLGIAQACGAALIIGTTGHSPEQLERVHEAAAQRAVLKSANMSIGVNVLARVVADVARILGPEFDCEIAEAHHRYKLDAPSGTALFLLDGVLNATERTRAEHVIYGREGHQPRRPGEIAVHTVRLGGVVGEHEVRFGSMGETLTLGHTALSREVFAAGALRAAAWIHGKPPGLYGMSDVLFGPSQG